MVTLLTFDLPLSVFSSHPFLALLPFPILRGLRVYQSLPRVGRGSIKLDSLLSSFDLICIFEFREPTERHQSGSTASILRRGLNPEQRPRSDSKASTTSIKLKRIKTLKADDGRTDGQTGQPTKHLESRSTRHKTVPFPTHLFNLNFKTPFDRSSAVIEHDPSLQI